MAKKKTRTELEIERLEALRETMDPLNVMNDNYKIINARLKELYELRDAEKKGKKHIDPPTGGDILKVCCYIALGGLILCKETLIGPIGNTNAMKILGKMI